MAIEVLGMVGEPALDKVITFVQGQQGSIPLYPQSIRTAIEYWEN